MQRGAIMGIEVTFFLFFSNSLRVIRLDELCVDSSFTPSLLYFFTECFVVSDE
jgi:hypothetical protein